MLLLQNKWSFSILNWKVRGITFDSYCKKNSKDLLKMGTYPTSNCSSESISASWAETTLWYNDNLSKILNPMISPVTENQQVPEQHKKTLLCIWN